MINIKYRLHFWASVAVIFITVPSFGSSAKSASPAKALPSKKKSRVVDADAKASAPKRSIASIESPILKPAAPIAGGIPRSLAAIDPNSAVEIRGQARTLSMMLVLKNGKDSINFIKVRKNYKPEIAKTEF